MKCKFCGAEVGLGKRCGYCDSVAEEFYYKDIDWDKSRRMEYQKHFWTTQGRALAV